MAAVSLLIIFLVPGFIWHSIEGQFVYLDRRIEWEKFALGLLVRSTIIYAPFASALYQAWQRGSGEISPSTIGITFILLVLILPAAMGFLCGRAGQQHLIRRFAQSVGISTLDQNRTAWDAVFDQIPPCWVIITLKDGKLIRGFLGPPSHISTDPTDRDLYISHLLLPDESGFVKNTSGIYITANEISTVELISVEKNNDEK